MKKRDEEGLISNLEVIMGFICLIIFTFILFSDAQRDKSQQSTSIDKLQPPLAASVFIFSGPPGR